MGLARIGSGGGHTLHARFSLVSLVALVLIGCGSLKDGRKADRLEASLSHYGSALRWSYFDSAFALRDPQQAHVPLPDMRNVRLTGYEVVQAPVLEGEETAIQLVRIEYVRDDEQRVQVILDRQHWRYDPERQTWWLLSPLPSFR
jgi:hypothetical protein